MANYFNSLPLREQLNQLGVCEFISVLSTEVTALLTNSWKLSRLCNGIGHGPHQNQCNQRLSHDHTASCNPTSADL